ncbi:MAG: GNAT family N-acetyltransferase [Devosia sp.]
MADIPTLETERLRLRPYRLADFEDYARMWSEPDVVRFIGGAVFTREQSWGRFLRLAGLWHYLGFGFFAIEHKATGAFAGECGFHDMRRNVVPSLEGTMETGWALTPPMQGQGLAEEAVRAAIGWAGQNASRDRLTCMIDTGNAASLRVAAKLGFVEFARALYNGEPIVLLDRPRLPASAAD